MQKTLSVVLLILTCPVWGQVPKKELTPVLLFSIQNKPVYAEEFIYLYRKNHVKKEDFTEQKVNEYLNLFINFKLKVTEARARGLDTTAVYLKEFNTYKEELKRPFTAEKDEMDRLTREVYQRLTEEIKASHILIAIKQDAAPQDSMMAYKKIQMIRDRILKGEDFEKLAKEFSEDPSVKTNGGNLGYFTALQMVYPFEQAAFQLKPGEVSLPVHTRFGYHLIKVTDRRPARGEVEVSHILLRTSSSDDTKVKNKIFEIDDQLQGGRSWDEICKEYSDDLSTKDHGGRLRPFGVGAMPGVPEFEAMAFSLKEPQEISDPFKSAYGWHIIRLEKRIPVPPYKDMEASLQRKVKSDERLQISARRMVDEKKRKFEFSENIEMNNVVHALADTSLKNGNWKFKGNESLRTQTFFSLGNNKYTVGEFIHYVEKSQKANTLSPATYMEQLHDRFLQEKLNDVEEAQLISENSEFRALLNEYKEGILLFTIMEQEVWNKASGDSLGQHNYFLENKEKYKAGNRVSARIYSMTDKNFLDEVVKKVSAGDSIKGEIVKKFKTILPLRNYERGENKAVDKVQWAVGVHTAEVDGTYYLVTIDNLVPPGVKSFEDARAKIISDYQEALEKRWIVKLKQKYPVKVNNKGNKYVINELTKK